MSKPSEKKRLKRSRDGLVLEEGGPLKTPNWKAIKERMRKDGDLSDYRVRRALEELKLAYAVRGRHALIELGWSDDCFWKMTV